MQISTRILPKSVNHFFYASNAGVIEIYIKSSPHKKISLNQELNNDHVWLLFWNIRGKDNLSRDYIFFILKL